MELFPRSDEAGVETKQPYSLEANDANAIEEVNLAYENVKEVECLDITKEGSDAWDAAVKRYDERIGNYFNYYYLKILNMLNVKMICLSLLYIYRSCRSPNHCPST